MNYASKLTGIIRWNHALLCLFSILQISCTTDDSTPTHSGSRQDTSESSDNRSFSFAHVDEEGVLIEGGLGSGDVSRSGLPFPGVGDTERDEELMVQKEIFKQQPAPKVENNIPEIAPEGEVAPIENNEMADAAINPSAGVPDRMPKDIGANLDECLSLINDLNFCYEMFPEPIEVADFDSGLFPKRRSEFPTFDPSGME